MPAPPPPWSPADAVASFAVRIAYPASHVSKLTAAAKSAGSKLSLTDRVGLVEDLLLLSEAGYTRTLPTLDFLSAFAPTETAFLVWAEIAAAFKRFADAWWEQPEGELDALRVFARTLFRPMVDKLGLKHLPQDDPDTRRFRALVVAAAAAVEDPECVDRVGPSQTGRH